MRKRGLGPKHQYVRRYPRWSRGRRKHVGDHKRGADPKPARKQSDRQMDFGF